MPNIRKRLYGPALLTNAAATLYTTPANTKTKVSFIHVQNPTGSPVTLTISIGPDAASKRIFDAYSIPAAAAGVPNSVLPFFCDFILEETEVIQGFAGTNNVMTITIDGEENVLG